MVDATAMRKMLESHGQAHLLRFTDELTPPERTALMEQIQAVDFDELDGLIEKHLGQEQTYEPAGRIDPAPVIPVAPVDEAAAAEYAAARERGDKLIASGKVAAFVVAGGQGTRLGYEGPKGCLEATPVTRKPLFQIFAEQILAASRRAAAAVPWYVMTSPGNDVATRAFFRRHGYFGLDENDVFFLAQGMMPAMGLDGRVMLSGKGELALSPNGHGGSLSALRDSGALEDMAGRGVEFISYFQVDNPLVRCVDPLFIGLHEMRGAEMSLKCLAKRDPMEGLGNVCLVDGKLTIIEYSDMPERLARATTKDGRLKFSAGSIAIHVLSQSFVERLTAGGEAPLPFHRAEKKVTFVDESGKLVKPHRPNAIKLEMFVFDAVPLAKQAVVLETLRGEEFSPIKNASGPDSLATSLHDQIRRAAGWLEKAGITVPRDADGRVAAAIEISPLFADSAEELAAKVDKDLKIAAGQNLYLG